MGTQTVNKRTSVGIGPIASILAVGFSIALTGCDQNLDGQAVLSDVEIIAEPTQIGRADLIDLTPGEEAQAIVELKKGQISLDIQTRTSRTFWDLHGDWGPNWSTSIVIKVPIAKLPAELRSLVLNIREVEHTADTDDNRIQQAVRSIPIHIPASAKNQNLAVDGEIRVQSFIGKNGAVKVVGGEITLSSKGTPIVRIGLE